MPLNPVKSTHEGDWLHFKEETGGEKMKNIVPI